MSHPHTRLSLGAICVPGSVFLPVPSRFSGPLFVAINPAERLDTQFACGAFSLSKPGCSRLWRGSFWYRKRVGMPLPKSTPHLVRCAFFSAMPGDSLLPAQHAPQKMDLAVFFGLAEKIFRGTAFSRENPPALINGHIDWI